MENRINITTEEKEILIKAKNIMENLRKEINAIYNNDECLSDYANGEYILDIINIALEYA